MNIYKRDSHTCINDQWKLSIKCAPWVNVRRVSQLWNNVSLHECDSLSFSVIVWSCGFQMCAQLTLLPAHWVASMSYFSCLWYHTNNNKFPIIALLTMELSAERYSLGCSQIDTSSLVSCHSKNTCSASRVLPVNVAHVTGMAQSYYRLPAMAAAESSTNCPQTVEIFPANYSQNRQQFFSKFVRLGALLRHGRAPPAGLVGTATMAWRVRLPQAWRPSVFIRLRVVALTSTEKEDWARTKDSEMIVASTSDGGTAGQEAAAGRGSIDRQQQEHARALKNQIARYSAGINASEDVVGGSVNSLLQSFSGLWRVLRTTQGRVAAGAATFFMLLLIAETEGGYLSQVRVLWIAKRSIGTWFEMNLEARRRLWKILDERVMLDCCIQISKWKSLFPDLGAILSIMFVRTLTSTVGPSVFDFIR